MTVIYSGWSMSRTNEKYLAGNISFEKDCKFSDLDAFLKYESGIAGNEREKDYTNFVSKKLNGCNVQTVLAAANEKGFRYGYYKPEERYGMRFDYFKPPYKAGLFIQFKSIDNKVPVLRAYRTLK